MKLLFDHCVPRTLRALLAGHEVHTAADLGWDELRNGKLLAAAAAGSFDAVITVDQNMPHQQDPRTLPLAVVVIRARSNATPVLVGFAPAVLLALEALTPRAFTFVPPPQTATDPAPAAT